MIENVKNVEQGIIDGLAQAKLSGEATDADEAIDAKAEFSQALAALSQDQKDALSAKIEQAQTKGGLKQQAVKLDVKDKATVKAKVDGKSDVRIDAKEEKAAKQAADAKNAVANATAAAAAAGSQAKLGKQGKVLPGKQPGKGDLSGPSDLTDAKAQTAANAQGFPPSVMAMGQVLPLTQSQSKSTSFEQTTPNIPVAQGVQAQSGQFMPGKTSAQGQQQMPLVPAMNAVQPQASPAVTVLAPIVIQTTVPVPTPIVMPIGMPLGMPLAIPMMGIEVLDSDESQSSSTSSEKSWSSQLPMVSSQEFLEGRGSMLGVDRIDPRLVGRRAESRSQDEGSGFDSGLNHAAAQMGQFVSDPNTMKNIVSGAVANLHSVRGTDQSLPAGQAIDASNAMALASQVQGLARNGGGSVRLRVTPENLGEVVISVQSAVGQKLDVKLEASTPQAREVLQGSLADLRQVLTQARYDVGHIEVSHGETRMTAGVFGNGGLGMFGSSQWEGVMQATGSSSNYSQQGGGGSWNDSGGGSAWDRYFGRQESNNPYAGNGRGRDGYRKYQQAEAEA